MFCKYCGHKIDSDSIFCESCGKRIKKESVEVQQPIYQEPVKQEPVIQTPVYQAPIVQEPTIHTPVVTQEPKTKTYIPDFEPISRNPYMGESSEPTPAPKTEYKRIPEAPSNPKKNKNILPYIMLPVAVIVSGITALLTDVLAETAIIHFAGFYVGYVVGFVLRTVIYLGGLVLFSLFCKGINQKSRFVLSGYAGLMGYYLIRIIVVIAGTIILCVEGYDSYDGVEYLNIAYVTGQFVGIFPSAALSLLWFIASEKYKVNRNIKSTKKEKMVPGVLLGAYVLVAYVMNGFLGGVIAYSTEDFFGDNGRFFAWRVSLLLTFAISFALLFVFSLASKGGYKKLVFIGSALFSIALFEPLSMIIEAIVYGALRQYIFVDVQYEKLYEAVVVGAIYIPQYLLAIPVAIVIYTLLNKYVVEKTKKIKE